MADQHYPFAAEPHGVRLAIRLIPGARRNALEGIAAGPDGRPVLRLRLTAPPVEGAANKALIEFLANALDLRKADISLRSGETSRLKILYLSGDTLSILERLGHWIGNHNVDLR